ncbi:MAG: aminotransferase class I/II-fold pyridoxal phosphate-dependent enzyme [Thermoanaerobaculia bacterium]|jgi:cystathionine gamma-synthase
MRFETIATHIGGEVDEETGAIAPPIHLATTYELAPDGAQFHGYRYSREGNPTQSRLEAALAAIESGAKALAFGSGMAAGSAIIQALPPGARVIFTDDSYYAFRLLAGDFMKRWSLDYDIVSMRDLASVREALKKPAALVWAETPSNPLMNVVDIRELVTITHEAGSTLLVDSTFATPALQRPIELGADIVLQSTTKYLGGHSDVGGGALVFREEGELCKQVLHVRRVIGGVASPFNSWLVLRGIRSLSARMRVHCENAMAVATWLEKHLRVKKVHYPGLASHAGHAIARKQMSAFGGMLSFELDGTREQAIAVVSAVKLFVRATSLGGVESLMEHRASIEGKGTMVPETLIRCSIGLEHPGDLIADLEQALA